MSDEAELKRLQEQRDKKRLYNRNYYHQRVKPKKKKEKDEVAKMKEQLAQLTISPGIQNLATTSSNFGSNFNSSPLGTSNAFETPIGFREQTFDFTDGSFTPRYREVSEDFAAESRLREEVQRLTDLLNRTRTDFARLSEQNNVLKKDNGHLSQELNELRHQLYELTMINSSQLLPSLN